MNENMNQEIASQKKAGLDLLREPFPPHQIGKLAKGSKAQTGCPSDQKKKCSVCGGWHHPDMIHLDYVGHAALTDRLLDADPLWYWEPISFDDKGLPAFDSTGGLWIRLYVAGHSRIGYGNAEQSQYKEVGSREKEVIGDALRNAAMRFGAGLELWHKGDLHIVEDVEKRSEYITESQRSEIMDMVADTNADVDRFLAFCKAETFETIPASMYKMAIAQLNKKKATA